MRRLVLAIALLGCGRVGFDPLALPIDAAPMIDSPFAPTTDAPPMAIADVFGDCTGATRPGTAVDTSLDSTRPAENFGARDEMRVGNGRVSLVRFDLRAIPPDATVFSATLHISVSAGDALEQGRVDAARLHEGWTEGTGDFSPGIANWDTREASAAWTTPGAGTPGSRAEAVMGTFTPSLEGVRHDIPLDVAVVTDWLVAAANHGMALYGVDEGSNGAWLVTREHADPAQRPCLTVTYVPPP